MDTSPAALIIFDGLSPQDPLLSAELRGGKGALCKGPEALQAFSWQRAAVLGVGLRRSSGLPWSLDVMIL